MDKLYKPSNPHRQNRLESAMCSVIFFSFGATAHIWALAYLYETLRFTSVY
jgi:hypothetical protein